MFGYGTFNVKYYILSQIFYKKNRVIICGMLHEFPFLSLANYKF